MQCIYDAFSFVKRGGGVAPTLVGGLELRPPKVAEMLGLMWNDDMFFNGWCYVIFPLIELSKGEKSRTAVWELDLPCFDTDYDKTVTDLRLRYTLWQEHAFSLRVQGVQSLDSLAFAAVIEQEIARAKP